MDGLSGLFALPHQLPHIVFFSEYRIFKEVQTNGGIGGILLFYVLYTTSYIPVFYTLTAVSKSPTNSPILPCTR